MSDFVPAVLTSSDVCAVVLAGGQGVRMGGLDKGLQHFGGQALVNHALDRLQLQLGGAPAKIAINANRNIEAYERFGVSVWADSLSDFQGPLAGFLSALEHNALSVAPAALILTVPCDSPLFPLSLLERLMQTLDSVNADIAVACAPETDSMGVTTIRRQPVFCLMRTQVSASLAEYVRSGGRKIDTWMQKHPTVEVHFDLSDDSANAFFNANTLDELRQLESP